MSTEIKQTPPALPATEQKQISDPDKAQRFAQLRERMKISRLEVIPPAGCGFKAYWGPRLDEHELNRLDYLGFRPVKEKDPKKPEWKAAGLREDGTYQLGDLVLMYIPQDEWDFLEQQDLERANAQPVAAKEGFREAAARHEVPTFEVRRGK